MPITVVIILKDLEKFYSVPILQEDFLPFVSSAGNVIQSVTPIQKIGTKLLHQFKSEGGQTHYRSLTPLSAADPPK